MRAVGLGARHDERRGVHLAPQQSGRVELLGVDVLRVPGERERQPGDRGGQPRDGGRAVREVRVQSDHVARGVEPIGEVDREQELLDVDLARRVEKTAPGPDRLRHCPAGGTGRAPGVASGGAQQGRPEVLAVVAEPSEQSDRGQRGRLLQVVGPDPDAPYDVVLDVLVGRLQHVQAQRHPEAFHPVDLAGDEHLGQPRVALQHVGHPSRWRGPVTHGPAPAPACAAAPDAR